MAQAKLRNLYELWIWWRMRLLCLHKGSGRGWNGSFYPGRVQGLPLLSVRRRISDCKKTDLMRKYLYLRRSSLKKSVIRQEHSSPRIPVSTFTWWLNPGSLRIFNTEPAQPAFAFMDPMTTRGILACTMAPAHMDRAPAWHTAYNPPAASLPLFCRLFLWL